MNTASRSENTARNIGVGAVRQVVTLLLAFAVRTVFVRRLGADYTGVNGLYSNILAMLSLAELGVGNVLVYSLYAPLHRGDTGEIQHLLGYYRRIYRLIALAVALLGAAVIPFLPLIISSELPMAQLIVYYVLYLANSVASYLVIYKTTLIQADQKAYLQNMVSAAALVLQYAAQIACLLIWGSYLGYLLIQIACTLLQNAVLSHLADKMYPFLRILLQLRVADDVCDDIRLHRDYRHFRQLGKSECREEFGKVIRHVPQPDCPLRGDYGLLRRRIRRDCTGLHPHLGGRRIPDGHRDGSSGAVHVLPEHHRRARVDVPRNAGAFSANEVCYVYDGAGQHPAVHPAGALLRRGGHHRRNRAGAAMHHLLV